tara:strand:+ start:10658 stop:11116 length:459 start_codon:yes stop_codon:yes gene_type:complete
MPKKVIAKKIIKKTPLKTFKKPKNTNEILVENFVSLQRVMTNLSLKFDNLSTQISKLLELFEISAKTIAEKTHNLNDGQNGGEMVGKLDNLLEQNKVIARGLTLLHESKSPQLPPQQPRNIIPPQARGQKPINKIAEYQKSISSTSHDETKI